MHLKFNGSGMYYLQHEPLLAVIGPTGKNGDDLQDPGSQEVHFLSFAYILSSNFPILNQYR